MPEITHKDQPSLAASAAKAAPATVDDNALAAKVAAILQKNREAQAAKAQQEPDWSKVTEADIANPAVYIPVIEHDVPDYMNMKLKDDTHMCVWVNKDQRRMGSKLAEGYEFLTKEHVHPQFTVPLAWTSEGRYEYADVVCMRVHKRILLGNRRRALELSQKQLRNANKLPQQRIKDSFELSPDDVGLDPGLSIYNAQA